MKRRLWSILLVIAALLFALTSVAFAIDASEYEGLSPEEYAQWKTEYVNSETDNDASLMATGYVKNDFIEIYVNGTGRYTMGTTGGNPDSSRDDNKLLLYGHPDSTTTETLIVVDGYEEFFDSSNTTFSADGKSVTSVTTINGIKVEQILSIIENESTGNPDVASIKYVLTNTTSSSKQVGARIMLDTMLGSNDGAPFKIPGIGDVTKECEFFGDDIPEYWQAVDSLTSYSVISTGDFYKNIAERPDKVQFADWPRISGSSWNYEIDPTDYVTNDSAVAAYFNPRTVLPGQSRTVVTYYGLSEFVPVYGEVSAILSSPSILYANDDGGYDNNPFIVTNYIDNQTGYALNNVSVRLVLPEGLEIEGGDATTKRISYLSSGSNTNVAWTLRALAQEDETTVTIKVIVSSPDLDEDIVVEKDLLLEEVEEEKRFRTITFNLNGAPGTPPAPQVVLIGTKGVEPKAPTRAGYVFDGWYANRACTGTDWFNIRNIGRLARANEDITLYAKWREGEVNLSYLYGFSNSYGSFNDTYAISNEYFDILTKDYKGWFKNAKIEKMRKRMNEDWEGSCYGMSVTEALMMAGVLTPDFYDPNVRTVRDLNAPAYDSRVGGMINFYQLSQSLDDTAKARRKYDKFRKQDDAIRDLVSTVSDIDGVNDFVCLCLENTNENSGHAVIAYGIENQPDGSYRINIFESNENDSLTDTYIIVDSAKENATFYCDWNSAWNGISVADKSLSINGILAQSDYNPINLQRELIIRGYETAPMSLMAEDDEDIITTSFANFAIEDEDGNYSTFDGENYEGGFTPNAIFFNDLGELEITYPLGDFYKIYCLDDENADYYEITLLLEGKKYIVIKSESLYTVTVSNEDGIIISLDEENTVYVSIAEDGTEYGTFFVETFADELVIEKFRGEYILTNANGFNDTTIGITNGNSSSSTTITTDGENIAFTSEEDSDFIIINNDGESIGELPMVYNVSFYTYGGTFVDDYTGLEYGCTIEIPEDPEFDGFVFGGWYKTAECLDGEEWDFDNDEITEDTILHAKWLVDEDFMHSVTFKAEGSDDIIVLVRDGEDLVDVPEVPFRDGFAGQWDIDDFTNITSNIIVNALYYEAVKAPVANPCGGVYNSAVTVTLSTETEGAEIYYTLDGTNPKENGVLYNGSITIHTTSTLKAYAVCPDSPSSAVITEEYIINDAKLMLEVQSKKAKASTEVKVDLKITDNPGVAGMAFTVFYDSSVLELVSFDKLLATELSSADSGNRFDGEVRFQYAGTTNVIDEGVLISFNFRVKDDAPLGFTAVEFVPEENSFFGYSSQDEYDIEVIFTNGGINVVDFIPGDVNGDGEVNTRDAARILQYLALWNVDYVEEALDVTGDGIVNVRDAARILQYLAGWDVAIDEDFSFVESICTVSFNLNYAGATGAPERQTINNGEYAIRPENPERDGFAFAGWYLDSRYSQAFNFSSPVTKSTTVYARWIDTEDTTDTDGDGITDAFEDYYGTSKFNADTDGDELNDYFEITISNTNPLNKDSDSDGLYDSDEDFDDDGLTNLEEQNNECNPYSDDTDFDGLNDYDEIYVYFTNPNLADTDEDGLDDADEIELGLDPLEQMTDGETLDSERTFEQTLM